MEALVIGICDVSGSMGMTKKRMAKEYYELVLVGLKLKYGDKNVGQKFITHTTAAKEVGSKEQMFETSSVGGTYLSSGTNLALEIIKGVDTVKTDVYVFHFNDGGKNWGQDNEEYIRSLKEIFNKVTFFQFIEIKFSDYDSAILSKIKEAKFNTERFSMIKIGTSDDGILEKFIKTRKIIQTLESPNQEIRQKDKKRIQDNKDIVNISRFDKTTKVTLADDTTGISKCNPSDTYNEEIGFKIAYLRAKIDSSIKQLIELTKDTDIYVVIDQGKTYNTYSELARRYTKNGLIYESGHVPAYHERLELIEFTQHSEGSNKTVAVCKDSENRIILIGDKGIRKEN